jgi:hypothetical protein
MLYAARVRSRNSPTEMPSARMNRNPLVHITKEMRETPRLERADAAQQVLKR